MSTTPRSCHRTQDANLQTAPISITFFSHINENIMKKPVHLLHFATVMISICVVLSVCATNKQSKTLDETLKQYEIVVRWSQWDGAIDFLAFEYLENHPISRLDMDRLRLFRVTQYTVRSAIPFNAGMGLRQVVEIRLFNRNRAVERSLIDQQEWRYNAERERWLLHSGLPDVTKAR